MLVLRSINLEIPIDIRVYIYIHIIHPLVCRYIINCFIKPIGWFIGDKYKTHVMIIDLLLY